MQLHRIVFLGLIALLVACQSGKVGIEAQSGWVRAMPAGSTASAAYLTLENHGPEPDALLSVEAQWAPRILLHRTEARAGVLRMGHLERVELPVGERVEANENTWHIMLMGLAQPPREGETLDLLLRFEHGPELSVELPVLREAPAG